MTHEQLFYGNKPAVGFGQTEVVAPPTGPSAWTVAIVTSVIGGATSWVVEEISKKVRKR